MKNTKLFKKTLALTLAMCIAMPSSFNYAYADTTNTRVNLENYTQEAVEDNISEATADNESASILEQYPASELIPTNEQIADWIDDGTWDNRLEFMTNLSVNNVTSTNTSDEIILSDMVHAMPATGNVNVPVFLVEFPDCKNTDDTLTVESIKNNLFGDGDSSLYPYESLINYYKRSSYGKLNLSGDVYDWYELSGNKFDYTSSDTILSEIMSAMDDSVDFSQYDSDKDGYIDGIYIMYAGSTQNWGDMYWSYTAHASSDLQYDGVNANSYVFETASNHPLITIHETGHMLGLPDYYMYDLSDIFLMEQGGLGYFDMMDNNHGDHNLFSKLILGWIEPTFITTDSDIVLKPATDKDANVIIVTPDKTNSIYGEYYLLELYTNAENNYASIECETGGIKIYHVNSKVEKDTNGYYHFVQSNMYATDTKLIKLLESGGKDNSSLLGHIVTADNYYYEGMKLTPNTVPGSEFYEGIFTGINICVNTVNNEQASVSISFSNEDTVSPQPINSKFDNILGNIMTLRDYEIEFNSYIYKSDNFDNIICYEKNAPENTISLFYRIQNPKTNYVFHTNIDTITSQSNYNRLIINSEETLKNGTEYIISIPQGAVKDAYGNVNDAFTQSFKTVSVIDYNVNSAYELKVMPDNVPAGYYFNDRVVKNSVLLADGSLMFIYSACNNDQTAPTMLIIKKFNADGTKLVDTAISVNGTSYANQYIYLLERLDNDNVVIVCSNVLVILDKDGQLLKNMKLDYSDNAYIKSLDRGDCIDFYSSIPAQAPIYRVHKANGTIESIIPADGAEPDSEGLEKYNRDYTKTLVEYGEDMYIAGNNRYTQYLDNNDTRYYNIKAQGIAPVVFSYSISKDRIYPIEFVDKKTLEFISDKNLSYASTGGRVTSFEHVISQIDSNYYKTADIFFGTSNGVCRMLEIDGCSGYVTYMAAYCNQKASDSKIAGTYIMRWSDDFDLQWITYIDNANAPITSIKSVSYADNKLFIIGDYNIIHVADIDMGYVSSHKDFDINNYEVNDTTMSILSYNDVTVKDIKNNLTGEYLDVKYFDSTMKEITDENTSLMNGLVRISDVNGIHTWYYKVTWKLRTEDGVMAGNASATLDKDVVLKSDILKTGDTELNGFVYEDKVIGDIYTDNPYIIYNIWLEDLEGASVEAGNLTLSLPQHSALGDDKVYHLSKNGKLTLMNTVCNAQCYTLDAAEPGIYIISFYSLETGPDFIYGDANGDNDVNVADAVALKKYLAGFRDEELTIEALDVNADNVVDTVDAVKLMKKLAGMNIDLGSADD